MKATEANLLKFLRKSPQFVIPIYQRNYSWTEAQCRKLWNDLLRAGREAKIEAHFIGSIVYVERGLSSVTSQEAMLVIDGQQRLTTTTLLIAALAEHFKTNALYDSAIERDFAIDMEKNEAVKVYAKLPAWFKVPTPLGTYNPDWAVLIELDGQESLYFVVETKSSLFEDDLRSREGGKIKCGAAHFDALAVEQNPAIYEKLKDVESLINRARGIS